jgi:hypothetical protein
MKRCIVLLALLIGSSIGTSAQTCATFPCVVASVSLTDQVNGITATPIFTPPARGVFRISAYLSVAKADQKPNALWNLEFLWTDDQRARQTSYNIGAGISNSQNAIWVVQSVGGVPLLFKTRSMDGRVPYNLFIVVEQLM